MNHIMYHFDSMRLFLRQQAARQQAARRQAARQQRQRPAQRVSARVATGAALAPAPAPAPTRAEVRVPEGLDFVAAEALPRALQRLHPRPRLSGTRHVRAG